jgi:branched-chain amino acid transport system ATP-binding protein
MKALIENLSKSFGGVKAVNNLSLELFPNRINAIIGPNGAGKTTLFNLITGFIKPDSGKIFFDDIELTHLPIHEISLLGIKRTLQIKSVFNSMTVYENLWITLSAHQGNVNPFKEISRYPEIKRRVNEIIEQLGLEHFANIQAGALSYGDVALLEIGMAIITSPKMILFDEPVCGMSPAEIWCNESQERYVLALAPESLALFTQICERERCPFAVVGYATAEQAEEFETV